MHTATAIGGAAAIVSGVIGVFTVIRGQSFAGHALADVSSAGGAASFLFGVNPMLGFLGMAVLAPVSMELVGVAARRAGPRDRRRPRRRPRPNGFIPLFRRDDHSTTGAAISVMFGSMLRSRLPLSRWPWQSGSGR